MPRMLPGVESKGMVQSLELLTSPISGAGAGGGLLARVLIDCTVVTMPSRMPCMAAKSSHGMVDRTWCKTVAAPIVGL